MIPIDCTEVHKLAWPISGETIPKLGSHYMESKLEAATHLSLMSMSGSLMPIVFIGMGMALPMPVK